MKPADQVISARPSDTIRHVMDLMLKHKVGAVVILALGTYPIPVGIVTKTDLVKAYNAGLQLDRPVKEIMTKEELLATCTEHMSRDEAAKILEHNQNHHAIVIDPETKNFRGLLSSWDITVECAKDDRAWPWNRSEDGKFHKPSEKIPVVVQPTATPEEEQEEEEPAKDQEEKDMGTSPTTTLFHPTADGKPKLGDSFREMMENLVYFD